MAVISIKYMAALKI